MNVLQVIPELNVGGVETGTVDFAKYLVQHGHKAVVVSNGGKLVSGLETLGARHYCLPVHKKSLWAIIRTIGALRKIIQDEKIDIVHARSRVPAWISYFACRKTKAAFITTCHGYYKSRIFSQVMGWSKLVIVPSKVIGRHMIDDFNVLPRSIRRIPRSVDLEKFTVQKKPVQGKSSCTITIVGRITPLKGHTYFLKAMAKVIRTVPYAKIWVVGDAPIKKAAYKKELELLARRLGIESHVEFLGNRRDIPQILAQTDVLVLSTVTQEAFGRVILEAQAAGVPVVATKVGGVIDIIDEGETGLLVFPKDTDGMAQAVIRLVNDRVLADRLVAQAKVKLEGNFTLEHMASSIIKVYEELLNSVNILVIKIASVGDVVLVTASLKAIRKKFPYARIHCLVGKESRKILHNCPYLDGVIVYDIKGGDRGWLKLLRLSAKLRKYRFDKIIDFQNSRKSHLLSFLSFTRESYGYNSGKWGYKSERKGKEFQGGRGIVSYCGEDVWQMFYNGHIMPKFLPPELDDKTSLRLINRCFKFLNQMLLHVEPERPFRGPEEHRIGKVKKPRAFLDMIYCATTDTAKYDSRHLTKADISHFSGHELIILCHENAKSDTLWECGFGGGFVGSVD